MSSHHKSVSVNTCSKLCNTDLTNSGDNRASEMSERGAPLERGDSYEDQLRGLFLDCCPDHGGGSMSSSRDLERLCRHVSGWKVSMKFVKYPK